MRSAKNLSRVPWCYRPIVEKKLGIFGTRAGVMLLFAVLVVLIENPWVVVVLLALAVAGVLVALAIRRSNRQVPPTLGL